MIKLVILGGSGIGMIAASIANDLGNYHVIGFLNDSINPGQEIGKFNRYAVLGRSVDYVNYLDDADVRIFVSYVGMTNERNTFSKLVSLNIPRDRLANLIHPTAIIPKGFASIGRGVLMAPLSQISPDTTVSDNCILLANSFLGHNSTMKRFSHIATNGVVGANVIIGTASHIGSNSTIRERVTIGKYSLVGAGSVVLKDVPDDTIVAGNPARIVHRKKTA